MPRYTASIPEDSAVRVEPGEYDVVVEYAKDTQSRKNRAPMIELEVRILLPGGRKGPKVYEYLIFQPNTFWKIDQVRAATGEEVIEGEEIELWAEDFEGRQARCVIINGAPRDNGKIYNEIDRWLLPEEPEAPAAISHRPAPTRPAPHRQATTARQTTPARRPPPPLTPEEERALGWD